MRREIDKEVKIGDSFSYKGFRLCNRGYEDEDRIISNWFVIVDSKGESIELVQGFTYDDTGVIKYFKNWVEHYWYVWITLPYES
jgi:hypothetical protein|tara:strand:- start:1218 stop:1469 length:252 start_codon:yes stop_codon:yes gene_type:complete